MAEVRLLEDRGPMLRVLGRFDVVVGGRSVPLPMDAQRVLGFLAVADQPQCREVLAGRLWAESSQARAQASLRNALWRVRRVSDHLVRTTRDVVELGSDVHVDLTASRTLARRLIDGEHPGGEGLHHSARSFERELLPSWDDDWLASERERTRQLHIHALEALSRLLTGQRCYARAVEAALAAVAAEPLRESARVVLIEAHLAEGNRCEAVRELHAYRRLVRDELGVSCSPHLERLLQPSSALVDLVSPATA